VKEQSYRATDRDQDILHRLWMGRDTKKLRSEQYETTDDRHHCPGEEGEHHGAARQRALTKQDGKWRTHCLPPFHPRCVLFQVRASVPTKLSHPQSRPTPKVRRVTFQLGLRPAQLGFSVLAAITDVSIAPVPLFGHNSGLESSLFDPLGSKLLPPFRSRLWSGFATTALTRWSSTTLLLQQFKLHEAISTGAVGFIDCIYARSMAFKMDFLHRNSGFCHWISPSC
jgi:hypothetical protein